MKKMVHIVFFVEMISSQDMGDHPEVEGDYQKLLRDYKYQEKELSAVRSVLEELKRENQAKSRECKEAWKSLHELRNELMRKSMHVGSLGMKYLTPLLTI